MKVEIYTDGACSGNPGKGGYGIVMQVPEKKYEKHFAQGFQYTTNNRMELMAVITAFKLLKTPQNEVEIFTDSKYVCDSINLKWILGWKKKNFKDVKNPDLWKEFLIVSHPHQFKITWVKGHAGNVNNEKADQLAVKAIEQKNLLNDTFFENLKKQENSSNLFG